MLSSLISRTCLQLLAFVAVARCASDAGSNSPQLDGDSDCDCFVINEALPTYYANHMFFDFRSLSEYAGVPDEIKDETKAYAAPYSNEYFSSDDWTDVWNMQTWDNSYGPGEGLANGGTVLMVNSRSNVYIEKNEDEDAASDTYMTLKTKRLPGFQTASEFQSVEANYLYVSMRMLARTVGSAGAVTGMFTYRDESGELADIQESDVEILTRGPRNKIQYTNQPSYSDDGDEYSEATRNATTPDWSSWVVHRLDWTPDVVTWYADGEVVARIEYQTPRDPTDLHFSCWSDGGTWSGNMSMNHEARQEIQWIEVLYNTTDKNVVEQKKRDEGACQRVCSIDKSDDAGKSTVLSGGSAMRMTFESGYRGMAAWVVALGVALFLQLV
ncbi:hypothetical protein AK830_g1176 [Neonectria ditissima]|uniref:GH16 domain-containing protein n=1 Tax=Neonectria ditissima TaxID=78410 RepID=A0A0N8H8S2_9HYPO|nr:hypothetical protein AK830_g1176 [Neonectria ditissima]